MAKDKQVSLLRAEQVAEILNVSLSMAYKLMKRGEIQTVSIGRSKRVKQTDLNEYIENNVTSSAWNY